LAIDACGLFEAEVVVKVVVGVAAATEPVVGPAARAAARSAGTFLVGACGARSFGGWRRSSEVLAIDARGLLHASAFGVAVNVVVGVAAAAVVIPPPVCLGCQLAVLADAAIRRAPEHQAHMEWGLNFFILGFATCFAPSHLRVLGCKTHLTS
jgi:hypothetical protein